MHRSLNGDSPECSVTLNRNMTAHHTDAAKAMLWQRFTSQHDIVSGCVPLFETKEGQIATMPYGRDGRIVLKRSTPMEGLMRELGRQLIWQHQESKISHDGILYMMLQREEDRIAPLYIGKAELFGKGDKNLSANISDLKSGNGKFGRWGYNYAYHIGDLSAITCPGHAATKKTIKYAAWRDQLFQNNDDVITPKSEIMFWATLWGPSSQSVWLDYGSTKLAFEEYLLIGVASDVFPAILLNREGRNRS
jgi:hypothetical protein